MNKIPKCTQKMIPKLKVNKNQNKELNFHKIKILNTKSFGNDITNLVKNRAYNIVKKSSSCNEKVNNNIYNFCEIQKNKNNNIITNNDFFQKNSFINNNFHFKSLNNTLKTLKGNLNIHLGKKSCDEKDKHKLNKNISLNKNQRYETLKLNTNINKTISNRQNHSLNNDKNKTINIININNSINVFNNFRKIPVSKKIEKMPNKLLFSNPTLV